MNIYSHAIIWVKIAKNPFFGRFPIFRNKMTSPVLTNDVITPPKTIFTTHAIALLSSSWNLPKDRLSYLFGRGE